MAPPSVYSTTVNSSPEQEQLPHRGGDCRNQHTAGPPAGAMVNPTIERCGVKPTDLFVDNSIPSHGPRGYRYLSSSSQIIPTTQNHHPSTCSNSKSLALATSPAHPSAKPRPGKRRLGRPRNPPDLASNPKLYPTKGYFWSDDEGANEEDFKSKKTYKHGGKNAQNSADEDVAEDHGVEDKETNGGG